MAREDHFESVWKKLLKGETVNPAIIRKAMQDLITINGDFAAEVHRLEAVSQTCLEQKEHAETVAENLRGSNNKLRATIAELQGVEHAGSPPSEAEAVRAAAEGLGDYRKALDAIGFEYLDAINNFPKFASPHEGYAVILEEADELWDEVRLKGGTRVKMCLEAKQVAAMGLRFMVDCAPPAFKEPKRPVMHDIREED